MNPVEQANGAAQVVTSYGTLGAVLLGAALIIAGLLAAIAVLWRAREKLEAAREAAERRREDAQQQHYLWALESMKTQVELEHKFTDAASHQADAIDALRELVGKLLERLAMDHRGG